MRNPQYSTAVLFATLTLTASLNSSAAPEGYELLEDIPPPPKVIEGQPLDKPTITIKKDGEKKIEEYSINGDVYMIKVTPPNGTPYYLHREERDGAWIDDGPSPLPSIPKWVIFRF